MKSLSPSWGKLSAAWLVPLLLWSIRTARAEIREIDLILPATTASIRYTDGYIRAPGSIDLGRLTFSTVSENYSTDGGYGDGGGRAMQGMEDGAFAVDIAIFRLPSSCAGTRSGCDWTELGIGGKSG